jgi:hypothetical protein
MKTEELKKIAAKPKVIMLHNNKFRVERYMAQDIIVEYSGDPQEKIIELTKMRYLVDFKLLKKL